MISETDAELIDYPEFMYCEGYYDTQANLQCVVAKSSSIGRFVALLPAEYYSGASLRALRPLASSRGPRYFLIDRSLVSFQLTTC